MLVAGGNYAAVSVDGCAVRLSGDIATASSIRQATAAVRSARRARCAVRARRRRWRIIIRRARRLRLLDADGERKRRDECAFRRSATSDGPAEDVLKKNAAFLAPLEPVRWRSSMPAGPSAEGIHVKVPEQQPGGIRLWTATAV